jgi:hypothetical protein
MPVKFRSPKRRKTRQKSGYQVSGSQMGSTCRIETSHLLQPEQGIITFNHEITSLTAMELFSRQIGVIGTGIYIYPREKCTYEIELSWSLDTNFDKIEKKGNLSSGYWQGLGAIKEIDLNISYGKINNFKVSYKINTFAPISVYGLIMGSLYHPYLTQHDIYNSFQQKTHLYVPEILYLCPHKDALEFRTIQGQLNQNNGDKIVCKSCNRCDRFLPINIDNEQKKLGYSNHCIKKAPCQHSSFSRYEILNLKDFKLDNLNRSLVNHICDNKIISRFGHQLECRVCKKFFVNRPLNPTRNSTQHREDSLRRRALEVLISALLDKESVYSKHRLNSGEEFDVYIWNKFNHKCFNCQKILPSPKDMHLDHTLPLAYLWPLDSTATCLCPGCNSSKSDKFPEDFYSQEQLKELSKITGISLDKLNRKSINQEAVKKLFARINWFFDDFLNDDEYQKDREGKKVADIIYKSLQKVLSISGYSENLVSLYRNKNKKDPSSISLES